MPVAVVSDMGFERGNSPLVSEYIPIHVEILTKRLSLGNCQSFRAVSIAWELPSRVLGVDDGLKVDMHLA